MADRSWVAALVVGMLGGIGCASKVPHTGVAATPTASSSASDPAKHAAITGRVLDGDLRPMAALLVFEGGRSARTDVDGRFTLVDAPNCYDLTILTPDKSLVTVYRGLTRRELVLRHKADKSTAGQAHQAKVSGVLSGGGPYPLHRTVVVRFLSTRASAETRLGAADAPGPTWGPIAVAWNGPDTITGDVAVLQLGHGAAAPIDEGSGAWFAKQPVTLRAGEDANVTLAMVEVPVVTRPPPVIDMDGDYPLPTWHDHYRVAGIAGRAFHGAGRCGGNSPVCGPDLSAFGVTWCIEAFEWNPYIRSERTRCGPPSNEPVSLYLKAGPTFNEPAFNTPAAVGLRFAWSTVAGGVYKLALSNHGARQASAERPHIDVFTAAPSATWPDLGALGVAFPKPRAAYEATVTAVGPFENLDDLTKPDRFGGPPPADSWSGMSQELSVPVQHPIPRETAACQYPYGRVITCGPPPDERSEFYVLSAINNKLRAFPDFARAIGILCVRDCDTARAFSKAYQRYGDEHPGFDTDQPLEPLGPPPPLPESLRRKRTE